MCLLFIEDYLVVAFIFGCPKYVWKISEGLFRQYGNILKKIL